MAVSSTTGGLKTGVCLSTDRPDNPFEGQVIYETDTNRTLVWDNSAWVVVADNQVFSIDSTNNRVGINDTTPSYALDVTGDINASGALRVGGVEFGPVNEFTPAWNNLTAGNGTTAGWWATRGEIAIVYAYIELGSTSAMSTNPFLPIGTNGLPTPSTYGEYHYISDVILEEVGVQTLRGLLKWRDGNIAPVTALTSGTYMNQSAISSTVPFTWGTGDFLSILTMYRRA